MKEEASQSLRTTDDYAAPLVSHWQRGVGKVAAVSMPIGGPFSQRMRAWPEVGDVVRTLHRWSRQQDWPAGLAVQTQRKGMVLRVSLLADGEWQSRFVQDPPELRTQEAGSDQVRTHAWRRIEPGHLRTDLSLAGSEAVRGVVRIGDLALPFGPVSGQPGSEWQFPRSSLDALMALSRASGGEKRVNLTDAWIRPPQSVPKGTRLWWLWACAGLFLFEAFWSRTGGQRLQFSRKRVNIPEEKAVEQLRDSGEVTQPEVADPDSPSSRQYMFDKAKR